MVVPISITASKSGSDPSSSQNPEKHENVKPLPAVDATSMLMDESHGPEFCPYDDRKLEKEHVPDNGQTFAANPPCVGPQHVPHMLWMQQPLYPVAFQPNFVLRDKKDICDTRDKIAYQRFEFDQLDQKDQVISDLQTDLEKAEDELHEKKEIISKLERKLGKRKGQVYTKESSLRGKEAELTTCRTNLVHSENEIRQLQDEVYAKESSLREKEAELATCSANLDRCEKEKLQLQVTVYAREGSLRGKEAELAACRTKLDHYEAERGRLQEELRTFAMLQMELARCAAWSRAQSTTIQSLQNELKECGVEYEKLLSVHRKQAERSEQLERQLLHETVENKRLWLSMANARERSQTHPDESPIPQNGS